MLIGYRKVPVNSQILGPSSASTEPYIIQPFFATPQVGLTPKQLDRKLYLLRKLIDKNVKTVLPQHAHNFYCCSLSSRIIVYKGQLTSLQVRSYYPDLSDEFFMSAIALVHSRFATNTVPRWQLAQPFRCISHNGELRDV